MLRIGLIALSLIALSATEAREVPRERGIKPSPAETQVVLDFDRLFAVGPAGLLILDLAAETYELETISGLRFAGSLPERPIEKNLRAALPGTLWVNRVGAQANPGGAIANCRSEAQSLVQAVTQAAATCAAAQGNAETCRRAFEPVRQAIVALVQCLRPRG
ncbi:MAG: hypothetical protein KatS3mg125_0683 [Lysobacterales bacterium]|jgi:hypothetical protein|nr:MAG: hypothetical protein KatS3mg125_0683 [Xanthomonadales bacterium]